MHMPGFAEANPKTAKGIGDALSPTVAITPP